ncbi:MULTISPECIES: glutaminase [Corynebacterium]|uniref:Glutaminase n=1 Tax=Corynebacterium hadale TaxID=2026255 RepID=A0A269PGM8_9CORY|nr:glutaminase [Corynebacterium hadale]PAJ71386.1 glutaminase [Corynebacterium hadale]WKC58977.1 Glutaminase 1 [Corynebacterium hadale]
MPTPVPAYLDRILGLVRDDDSGEVADYIDELAAADPDKLGVALCTTSGNLYSVGDDEYEFTIQSISKPFVYALALEELGAAEVHKYVGVEPSGEAFNAISLEEDTHRPANPMINAGAIAVNQMINGSESSVEERVEKIRAFLSKLAGRQLRIDESLVQSELATAHRNLAIAHLLREFGMVQDQAHDAIDSYTQQCSVLVTVRDLATMAATLANGGVQPITGERVLSAGSCRITQAVMTSAGMYDGSGQWMVNVGIPAKSGVAGGLIGTMPGQLGLASLSPRLNEQGNSVRGVKIFREMSDSLGLNLMGADFYAAPGIRSVERREDCTVVELQGMINFTAAENILHDLASERIVGGTLVLDVSNVTSFNKAGRLLIKEGMRHLRDTGLDVRIYDPDGAMPDYEFSDGTKVPAIKDFSTTFTVPGSRTEVFRAISAPQEWWDEHVDHIEGSASEQGGEFHFDTDDQYAEFRVEESEVGDRLVWHTETTGKDKEDRDWDDTSLIFELSDSEQEDGETQVTFTHRGMHPHGEGYKEAVEAWRERIQERLEPLIRRRGER